ncbi:MAG: ATP-binding protein [Armatimonadota bacterium]
MAKKSVFELCVPCAPGFAIVARLFSSGVASRLSIPYDRIEDCKLAVGEACSAAIERAQSAGQTNAKIRLKCLAQDKSLVIEIHDDVRADLQCSGDDPQSEAQEIRRRMLEALVDHMEIQQDPQSGTLVRMVIKHDVNGD